MEKLYGKFVRCIIIEIIGGPRDTENILVYTGKILPVTTLLKSPFLVNIYYVIKQPLLFITHTVDVHVHLMRASSIHFLVADKMTVVRPSWK